jgi:hypothetical protein
LFAVLGRRKESRFRTARVVAAGISNREMVPKRARKRIVGKALPCREPSFRFTFTVSVLGNLVVVREEDARYVPGRSAAKGVRFRNSVIVRDYKNENGYRLTNITTPEELVNRMGDKEGFCKVRRTGILACLFCQTGMSGLLV